MQFDVSDAADRKLLRTWTQTLVDNGYTEAAAIAVDTEIEISLYNFEIWDDWLNLSYRVEFCLPPASYGYVQENEQVRQALEWAFGALVPGRRLATLRPDLLPSQASDTLKLDIRNIEYNYAIKLIEAEPDWQAVVRRLIVNKRINNQARVTEMLRARRNEDALVYNEMRFGSQSEIRIAQALERKGVLFFPLPLAVRHRGEATWKDHREPDFLICHQGRWGILEVSFHEPTRYEQDQEKDIWFREEGLFVQHYTAEQCYTHSDQVIEQFLRLLVSAR